MRVTPRFSVIVSTRVLPESLRHSLATFFDQDFDDREMSQASGLR